MNELNSSAVCGICDVPFDIETANMYGWVMSESWDGEQCFEFHEYCPGSRGGIERKLPADLAVWLNEVEKSLGPVLLILWRWLHNLIVWLIRVRDFLRNLIRA